MHNHNTNQFSIYATTTGGKETWRRQETRTRNEKGGGGDIYLSIYLFILSFIHSFFSPVRLLNTDYWLLLIPPPRCYLVTHIHSTYISLTHSLTHSSGAHPSLTYSFVRFISLSFLPSFLPFSFFFLSCCFSTSYILLFFLLDFFYLLCWFDFIIKHERTTTLSLLLVFASPSPSPSSSPSYMPVSVSVFVLRLLPSPPHSHSLSIHLLLLSLSLSLLIIIIRVPGTWGLIIYIIYVGLLHYLLSLSLSLSLSLFHAILYAIYIHLYLYLYLYLYLCIFPFFLSLFFVHVLVETPSLPPIKIGSFFIMTTAFYQLLAIGCGLVWAFDVCGFGVKLEIRHAKESWEV